MSAPRDILVRGLVPRSGVRFEYVDVSATARELEHRHLSGPAAGDALAQALAAVALISADLGETDERITFQLKVGGPLGGLFVEASASGGLRGYTQNKILDDLDGQNEIPFEAVLGRQGNLAVVRSTSRETLSTSQVPASPPEIRTALARYLNLSQQVPAAAELFTLRGDDRELLRSVGLVAEKMPDGDTDAFVTVLERFTEGAVRRKLETSRGLEEFGELLGAGAIEIVQRRELRFACQCSRDKVSQILRALPDDELSEMIAEDQEQRVTCHFCGESYLFEADQLREL